MFSRRAWITSAEADILMFEGDVEAIGGRVSTIYRLRFSAQSSARIVVTANTCHLSPKWLSEKSLRPSSASGAIT